MLKKGIKVLQAKMSLNINFVDLLTYNHFIYSVYKLIQKLEP